MPRNVRNSWVTLEVDGRERNIETGPRTKDGGMTAQFYVRNSGTVTKSVSVSTFADEDGTLSLYVYDQNDKCIYAHKTQR